MEKARVDALAEFHISQPFFDACGIYYGDGFKDCLKQVKAAYPNLNFSQIIINNTVLPKPGGDDTVNDETIDFVHMIEQEVKDTDGVVITQPTPDDPDAVMVLSAENSTVAESLPSMNPTTPNAPPSWFFFSFVFKVFFFGRIICKTVINAPFFGGFYVKTFTYLGYIYYFYPLPILIFCLHFNRVCLCCSGTVDISFYLSTL